MTIAWGKGSLFSVAIKDAPDLIILGHRFQCRVETKTLEGIYGLELDEEFSFTDYSEYMDEHGIEALTPYTSDEAILQAIDPTLPSELIPHCPEIVDSFQMFCRRARAGNSTTDPT
jgi:hypothetical protein